MCIVERNDTVLLVGCSPLAHFIQRLFHRLGNMRTHTHTHTHIHTQGKRFNNQHTRGHYNPSIRVLTFTDTPNLIVCTLDNEWVIVFVCLCHLSKEGFKNGLFGQLSQKLPPLCYLYGSACCLTDIFPRRCHLRKNQAFLCCYLHTENSLSITYYT